MANTKFLSIKIGHKHWNNNGEGKIPTSIIKSVRKLLMTIEFQPEIFPTACDALQLEWENDKDEYLEMEILEDAVNIFQIGRYMQLMKLYLKITVVV